MTLLPCPGFSGTCEAIAADVAYVNADLENLYDAYRDAQSVSVYEMMGYLTSLMSVNFYHLASLENAWFAYDCC